MVCFPTRQRFIRHFRATNDPYWDRSWNVRRTEYCFNNDCITREQTWIAAGMSSTMINTGFLLSMGIAFVILATSMPTSTLEAIFAGLPIATNELNLNLFMDAIHKIFLLLAAINVIAAVTSSLRGPKPIGQQD